MKQIGFSCVGVESVRMILLILLIIITGCAAHSPQKAIVVPEPLEATIEKFDPDTVSKLIQQKIIKS